jgi:hypothetical protein
MKRLRSCDGCKRHVFVSERECPFCHRQLTAAPPPADVSVPSGASRAQRLALAAALGGQGLVGCAQATTTPVEGAPVTANPGTNVPPNGGNAAPAAGGGGTAPYDAGLIVHPVYGLPLAGEQAAPTRPPADAGQTAMPVYGAPLAGQPAPRPDAGPADEDAGASDAGTRRDGGPVVHPVYGAPAPVYGAPAAK